LLPRSIIRDSQHSFWIGKGGQANKGGVMKRREFVAKGGSFLGLSLAGFGRMKEGKMQPQQPTDPKEVFLSRISASKKEFQEFFNNDNWTALKNLYWEDAVLVSKRKNEVYQGQDSIAGFWRDFKAQKAGRKITSIKPKKDKPQVRDINLIGTVASGEKYQYDMAAVDICDYEFNPDGTVVVSVDSYRHKKTCTTAIAEQSVIG
jgi:hypothetical protein